MCVLAFASKTMQKEFSDLQAQGQAIQWPKEKGQCSVILLLPLLTFGCFSEKKYLNYVVKF
jgi:hypothetical protein